MRHCDHAEYQQTWDLSTAQGGVLVESMIRPLIVGVAHGLDLVTFLMALAAFGIGGESNGLMQTAYLHGGQAGVIALKSSGATALALMAQLRGWAFVPAAAAGIVGAAANLLALRLLSP